MDAPQRSRGRGRGRGGNRGGRGGNRGGRGGGNPNSMMTDDGGNRRSQRQNLKSPVVAQFSRRGRGNRGGGSGRGPAMITDSDTGPFTITASGWDQLQDPNELAEWIQQGVGRRVDFVKAEMKGNRMAIFQVDDLGVAMQIQKLNGRKFHGKSLNIRRTGNRAQGGGGGGDMQMGNAGGSHQGPVNVMSSIETHYNAPIKALNLAQVGFGQFEASKLDLNNVNMMHRLFEVIRDRHPDLVTINFARNHIRNLVPFQKLHEFLPQCVNLCLEGNKIADFKQLDSLKNIKLRELILTDNPICAKPTYKDEVMRRFPQLELLDGQQVRPLFKFAEIPDIVLPPEKPAFFDQEANKAFAGTFLQKFLAVYDSIKREDLLDVYSDQSFFSVSAAVLSADAQTQQQQQQGQQGRRGGNKPHYTGDASGNLQAYIPFSHNLAKLNDPAKRHETMHKGRVDIVGALKKLPNTRHSLDDLKVEAFVLEGQPIQLLSIHVHGHFWDVGTEVKRSFNRVILLTPAGPHTRAFQSGWPALIVNDMLTIHNYLAPKPPASPAAVHAQPAGVPSMMLGAPLPGLTPEQNATVLNLQNLTNLRPEYARDCLLAAGWNVTNAMNLYMQRKMANLLPVEAWMPGALPR